MRKKKPNIKMYRVSDHKLLTVFTSENEVNPYFQIEQLYTDDALPKSDNSAGVKVTGSKLAMQFTVNEMRVLISEGIKWLSELIDEKKI